MFSMIFLFALLSLFLELSTGGGVFGTLFIVGLIFSYPHLNVSLILLLSLGCFFVLLEAFKASRGFFFLIGNVFFTTSLFLSSSFYVSSWVGLGSLIFFIILCLIVSFFFYLSFRKVRSLKKEKDLFALVGEKGIISKDNEYAHISGTLWKVHSQELLKSGDHIIVLKLLEDFTLQVKKQEKGF